MSNTETTTVHLNLSITIEHPEGTTITLAGGAPTISAADDADGTNPSVAAYFEHFLSGNGRAVFRAAAELDLESEAPYSLEQIAERLGKPYSSVVSMYRSTGRTAKKWRNETNRDAPFTLEWKEYPETTDGSGNRTTYRLPAGVARQIIDLAA